MSKKCNIKQGKAAYWLQQGSLPVAQIVQRARSLESLDREFSARAKDRLGIDCRVINLVGKCLVLAVDSSAMANRLRYQTDQIVDLARDCIEEPVVQVRIRVLPPVEPSIQTTATPHLSKAARDHLARMAASESDPELRQILQNLAAGRRDRHR